MGQTMFFVALETSHIPSFVQEMEWEVLDGMTWEVPDGIDRNVE